MRERTNDRLLMAAFAIAFLLMLGVRLGPSLVGAQVFTGYDMLDRFAPWSQLETAGDLYEANPFITDQLDANIPAIIEIGERLREGEIPLQTNLVAGGQPLLAGPNLGLISPSRWAWVVFPLAFAPGWAKLFEITFGASFVYLFARRVGLTKLASIVSSGVFPLTGFMLGWTGWTQSSVVAIIPMLLWAIERFLQSRRLRDIVPVSVSVALLLFGGFPAVAAHGVLFAGVYALARALALARGRSTDARSLAEAGRDLSLLAFGVILGVGVSAIQLLSFVSETLSGSEVGYRDGWGTLQDPVATWITLVIPRYPGGPASYQEIAAYVGSVALFLAALGFFGVVRRRVPWSVGYVLVGLIAFAVAMISFQGLLGLDTTIARLPLFDNNPPGRLRAQLALPLALLAGVGVEWLKEARSPREMSGPKWLVPGFKWPAAVTGFGLLSAIALYVALLPGRGRANWVEARWTEWLVALIPLAVVAIGVLCAAFIRRMRTPIIAIAIVAIPFQAMWPAAFFWPTSDPEEVYPRSEALDFLAERVGHDQVATVGLAMRPNVPNVYGVRLVNGHAFVDSRWKSALLAADPHSFSHGGTYSFFWIDRSAVFENPVLDRMGVTYAVADAGESFGQVSLRGDYPHVPETAWRFDPEIEWDIELDPDADLNGLYLHVSAAGRYSVSIDVVDDAGASLAGNSVEFGAAEHPVTVPVGLVVPSGSTTGPAVAKIHVTSLVDEPIGIGIDSDGQPIAMLNSPAPDDEYPLVYAGENILIWERQSALSRIRFVEDVVLAKDLTDAIELASSSSVPVTTAVLESDGAGATTEGTRTPASYDVVHDDGDRVAVEISTNGSGYLLIGQSILTNYIATIDGVETEIIPADIASGAIYVPEGSHLVEVRYNSRAHDIGGLITAVSLGVLVLIGTLPLIIDRRRAGATANR